jgi:uncharacterized protein (TIGR02246 family)
MRYLAFPCAVLLAAACQSGAETPEQTATRMQTESTAIRAVIDSMAIDFASHLNQGHADIVAAYYTEDAVIMPPNMPTARGRDGAKQVFDQFVAMKAQLTLKPESVSANGPMAVEWGTYSVTLTPPGAPAPMTDTGKYLVHWRQVDGKWLLAQDIWNSDLPPMPMPAAKP